MFAACAHRAERAPAPTPIKSTPLSSILTDLAENTARIETLEARNVRMIIQAPGLEAKQVMPLSTLYYVQPDRLHLIGRKFGGKQYARVTVAEGSFLLDLPVEHEFYYRGPGQSFAASAPEATPADVVAELFALENWTQLDPRSIVVEEQDATLRLTFPAGLGQTKSGGGMALERSIEVIKVQGRWVLRSSELRSKGAIIVSSVFGAHREQDGIICPMELAVEFPQEQAFMKFFLGSVSFNTPIDQQLFNLTAQLDRLRRQNHVERDPYDGS
ncbi:MAG: hypothetical protein HYV26_01380 [Candidatus Hydrogenedentes bacterium]|nr:hypothetical protein [Candidatus Hydrogenedentota bacterium]